MSKKITTVEAINLVLQAAADEIERELICCPDDKIDPRHDICRWAIASRQIVLSYKIETPIPLKVVGWGPFRIFGERKRNAKARREAEKLMASLRTIQERSWPPGG